MESMRPCMCNGSGTHQLQQLEKYQISRNFFLQRCVTQSILQLLQERFQHTAIIQTSIHHYMLNMVNISIGIFHLHVSLVQGLAVTLIYRFVYDSATATYTDVDHQRIHTISSRQPPNNCSVCLLVEQNEQSSNWNMLPTGLSYQGQKFHIHDFALIRSHSGPCHIGYITDIQFPGNSQHGGTPTIKVKLMGRISNMDNICPQHIIKDEVSKCFRLTCYLKLTCTSAIYL
jgi:hypothetical protein